MSERLTEGTKERPLTNRKSERQRERLNEQTTDPSTDSPTDWAAYKLTDRPTY